MLPPAPEVFQPKRMDRQETPFIPLAVSVNGIDTLQQSIQSCSLLFKIRQ